MIASGRRKIKALFSNRRIPQTGIHCPLAFEEETRNILELETQKSDETPWAESVASDGGFEDGIDGLSF